MQAKIALFFDIDGTLFDSSTKSVPSSTLNALKILSQKPNVDLYISSGRSYDTLGSIKMYEEYFTGFNLSNGQEIIINKQKYYGLPIDQKIVQDLIEITTKKNHSLGIISKSSIEMTFFTDESYHNFTEYIKKEVNNLDHQPYNLQKPVLQFWLFAKNDEIAFYKERFPQLEFFNWGRYGADILPAGQSKASGIKHIQKIKGYKTENMYAFGDGDNDVKMFEVVGTSCAMGNASPKALASADFITDDITNDGLFKALVKLKLL